METPDEVSKIYGLEAKISSVLDKTKLSVILVNSSTNQCKPQIFQQADPVHSNISRRFRYVSRTSQLTNTRQSKTVIPVKKKEKKLNSVTKANSKNGSKRNYHKVTSTLPTVSRLHKSTQESPSLPPCELCKNERRKSRVRKKLELALKNFINSSKNDLCRYPQRVTPLPRKIDFFTPTKISTEKTKTPSLKIRKHFGFHGVAEKEVTRSRAEEALCPLSNERIRGINNESPSKSVEGLERYRKKVESVRRHVYSKYDNKVLISCSVLDNY